MKGILQILGPHFKCLTIELPQDNQVSTRSLVLPFLLAHRQRLQLPACLRWSSSCIHIDKHSYLVIISYHYDHWTQVQMETLTALKSRLNNLKCLFHRIFNSSKSFHPSTTTCDMASTRLWKNTSLHHEDRVYFLAPSPKTNPFLTSPNLSLHICKNGSDTW